MANILDKENWVEIPEGEFITGLSDAQWRAIWLKIRDVSGYAGKPADIRENMDVALAKVFEYEDLSYDEKKCFVRILPYPYDRYRQHTVYHSRFYIARFQISAMQYWQFEHGTRAVNLPGFLTDSRCIAEVRREPAVELCRQLGARLPTSLEWEKAGRGTDGRLYPWGDEWDESRGFFYYGQKYPPLPDCGGKPHLDAYPDGVSPYGVWGMCGGLPDLIQVEPHSKTYNLDGKTFSIGLKGQHPRELQVDTVFFDHLLIRRGYSEWGVALRPVFDELPA
ncbi:MAG: SUMF1/EgtB/PvdO family nonheme iron enzyme [Chloroflexota bacterium]|nr:SUMF1/EgtB/PvdO family nonheme iron enzyme [Chloroflexota bacterium]